MYFAFFIYSLSGIFSKIAAARDFLSVEYLLCFGAMVFIMALYALLWQIVLKKIPLSVAMSSKPVVLVFSLLWAVCLFGEKISARMLLGILLIFCGIIVIGLGREKGEDE